VTPCLEALACTNCGAKKAYDYLNRLANRVLIVAVASAVLAAYFVYVGYTAPDPKVLSGANIIAALLGIHAVSRLFSLYRGRVWRRTWRGANAAK
jgi:hypothetical protein